MSGVSLRLPASLHDQVRQMAAREGISVNQFIMLAVAEKMAVMQAGDYLAARAVQGNRAKLLALLARAPDVEPDEADRLPG